jgi:hypothetical protein
MANATRIVDKASGVYHGKYSGTTAAQNIHIGFKPGFIWAVNSTDGDTQWSWSKDTPTVVYTVVALAAVQSIAVGQVDNGTVIGFSLPSDAIVNEDAKVYHFWAIPE